MIQVPSFGMENNPGSLVARRQAFMRAYGYSEEEVERGVELYTEVIGHVPSVEPSVTLPEWKDSFTYDWRVLLTFYSTVTPYTRAWVRQDAANALAFAMDLERSGLWTLAKISSEAR